MKAGTSGLLVKPYFLGHLSEALLRTAVDGTPQNRMGFKKLADWKNELNGAHFVRQLSNAVFPDFLRNELGAYKRLYLCPHRHLSEIPLHALFPGNKASDDERVLEGAPFFSHFEVSYALSTAHVMQMVCSSRNTPASPVRRWAVVDEAALFNRRLDSGWVPEWLKGRNQWGRKGLGIEELMAEGAASD